MGYTAVVEALESRDLLRGGWGTSQMALCPSHSDTTASLSYKEGEDGRALLYCHAGCSIDDIVEALGLSLSDLFTGGRGDVVADTYTYTDENGEPLIRVIRTLPKGFYQERWEDGEWKPGLRDTRRVLYHLPDVAAAIRDGRLVYLVEGEKDADNLAAVGVTTTTLLGGAGKWRDDYAASLAGAHVVLVPDRDDPGRIGAQRIRDALTGVASEVEVRVPATGKDITDHLLAGYGVGDLVPESNGLDEFGPLDWQAYDIPEQEWLVEPYIPKGGRVLAFGPAGSLKSLWAMWVGAKISRRGKKVAYFSLEMLPSDTAKRLRKLNPDPANFVCFTRDLKLGSPSHTAKLIAGLNGFDLVVIDSWTAARTGAKDSNEAIAALDNEVFLPLIRSTGAALVVIDNTGHDAITDRGKIKADHARGASAKGDKMEVTLWFRRPFEDNNYRTEIAVKKMRLDYPMPAPVTVETPEDEINFYYVDGPSGMRTATTMLDADAIAPTAAPTDGTQDDPAMPSENPATEMTGAERRALARLKDKFKDLKEVTDDQAEGQATGDSEGRTIHGADRG